MKQHRIEGDVAYFDRAWGTLKMDVQDMYLLDGWQITGKTTMLKCRKYIQVSIENGKRGAKRKRLVLSRVIAKCPDGMEVDHINHDPTDNRRCNLRICTRSENRRNGLKQGQSKGRFKGVFYHAHGVYSGLRSGAVKRWRAYTRVFGKRVWLGYHETEEQAAMAYNAYAAKEFAKFACFNRFDACPVLNMIKTMQHDIKPKQLLLL
jgi:hypothetical protein